MTREGEGVETPSVTHEDFLEAVARLQSGRSRTASPLPV
jgi:hypothetical protein